MACKCELTSSPRQREILRRIVEEYVATGQPVGSKTLVERAGLGIASSTVRAELAELESLGLLTHPHTSAGRVPTEIGLPLLRATSCSAGSTAAVRCSRSTCTRTRTEVE